MLFVIDFGAQHPPQISSAIREGTAMVFSQHTPLGEMVKGEKSSFIMKEGNKKTGKIRRAEKSSGREFSR